MIDVSESRLGLHEGVSFEAYIRWDAVNNSTLKNMARSPAHADYLRRHPAPETNALMLGHAIHTGILEPAEFMNRYVRGLAGEDGKHLPRQGKIKNALWKEFEDALPPTVLSILTPKEWDDVAGAVNSVRRNPLVLELMTGGKSEVCALTRLNGVLCKARIDKLTRWQGWTVVVDAKSTENAGYGKVKRDISTFMYHMQAAFYLAVLNAIAPMQRRFLHAFFEKKPPYESAVYEIDSTGLEIGAALWMEYLARYKACCEADNWPGYSQAINEVGLMDWAMEPFDIRQVA